MHLQLPAHSSHALLLSIHFNSVEQSTFLHFLHNLVNLL